MIKRKKADIKQEVIFIIFGLILLLLILSYNLIASAFTGPTASPTGGAGYLDTEPDEDLVFDPGGTKKFGINVSPTQALDVGGNVNISGNISTSGTLNTTGGVSVEGGAVFNESGANVDFRIEGTAGVLTDHLFFVDSDNRFIGIRNPNPVRQLDIAQDRNRAELMIRRANDTTIGSGDDLGVIEFAGSTDCGTLETTPCTGAQIIGEATENWASTISGGRLSFLTTPNGSNVPIERLRIDNNGDIVLVSSGGLASNINFNNGAATDGQIKYDYSTDKLGLYTNIAGGATNSAIVIDSVHRVGINIDPPTERLDVGGDIKTTRGGIVTGTLWTPIPLIEPSSRNIQTSSYIGQFTSTDTVNVPNVTQCTWDAATRTCSYPIPTVPASAKEIFVYYNLATDQNTTGGSFFNKLDYKIFTRDGALDYATYINVNDLTNDRGYTHGTAWLPLTPDLRLRVTRIYAGSPAFVPAATDANAIHIIGYR